MRQIAMTRPRRQKYRAARAFYLVILVLSVLAAWSIVSGHGHEARSDEGRAVLPRSDLSTIHVSKKQVLVEDKEVMHIRDLADYELCRDDIADMIQ